MKGRKKILITAGATWVKIDAVRILTNRFSGKTGLYLAKGLKKKGHAVTLLINPHCLGRAEGLKAVYYRYFEEFKGKIIKILNGRQYDAIIHMAAVSDYRLKSAAKGKIPSGRKKLTLKLRPAQKLIKTIRRLAPNARLIQFKLEAKRSGIADKAYQSLKENKSDFVVANALEDLRLGYKAVLVDRHKKLFSIDTQKVLVNVLDEVIRS